ncbi:MAG: phosphate ABC transporter substrate-binding/OmpA family protein [Lewinella sp.]|jgi:NitT/TauT family transport system substrate-binding protein|nr:phosphate ABC transporter substrate-binding/OmpA family protein [Lewinella sp.]
MARLTTFSKLLITILILLVLVFGFNFLTGGKLLSGILGAEGTTTETTTGDSGTINSGTTTSSNSGNNSGDPIRVGVVTWGGYAGGQYFNEGFKATNQSRFKKEYGIDVEFVLNDDVVSSLNAWKNGDIDVHWYTIDAMPTIMPEMKDFDPVVLWQADWSRGGDAIVVKRGINSVQDLRGKTVAVAELTPSHSFLLWLLDAGDLKPDDIKIVAQPSAIEAAAAFKSGQVDAAVVWSPDDELSVRAVPGSKILESTRSASNIISDVFFAKRSYVEANRNRLQKLYEGWMRGAAEINSSAAAKQKAAKILGREMSLSEADAMGMINNVRLTTHGDNVNFFSQNASFRGTTGGDLYRRMAQEYKNLGFIEGSIAPFRTVSYGGNLVSEANERLTGPEHAGEGQTDFSPVTEKEGTDKEAIATKRISINFPTGVSILDDNAKQIIDEEFVPIAKAFGNARIRIEGNTDNTGSLATNLALSKKRAQAVAAYLTRQYNMDSDRFIIVGNGPNKPIANNSSGSGRAQNRRTDFELVR